MNTRIITLQDCTEMYKYKDMSAVIHDGQVLCFIHKNEDEEDIEIPLPDWESEQR